MIAPKVNCHWRLRFHDWKLANVEKRHGRHNQDYRTNWMPIYAWIRWICKECHAEKTTSVFWNSFVFMNGGEKIELDFIKELER